MGYARSSDRFGNILGNILLPRNALNQGQSRRYKAKSGGLLIRRSASLRNALEDATAWLRDQPSIVAAPKDLDAFASQHHCEIIASVKLGTHSLAIANYDDQAIATLAAQTVVISCGSARVRYIAIPLWMWIAGTFRGMGLSIDASTLGLRATSLLDFALL